MQYAKKRRKWLELISNRAAGRFACLSRPRKSGNGELLSEQALRMGNWRYQIEKDTLEEVENTLSNNPDNSLRKSIILCMTSREIKEKSCLFVIIWAKFFGGNSEKKHNFKGKTSHAILNRHRKIILAFMNEWSSTLSWMKPKIHQQLFILN